MSPVCLTDPAFLRLWTATTASGLATWALPFVLGLLVLDGTLTPVELGLLLGARTVGFVAAVPLGGVLADRWDRGPVIVIAAVAAAAAIPVLLVGTGTAPLLALSGAALAGAGQGACRPAFQALTAEIVDAAGRRRANAAISLAVRVTTLVAPAVCAGLVLLVGASWLLTGIGALWLLTAIMVPRSTGPRRDRTSRPRPGLRAELVEGWQEARRHPWFLAGLGALTAVIATGYSATGVVLPAVSSTLLNGEVVLAAATTAYVLGAVVAALALARWEPHPTGWTALGGLAVYTTVPLALLLGDPVLIVVAFAAAGIGIELFNVPWFTAVQREVRPEALARVSSLDFLLSYGLAPFGLAVIAPAIDTLGATTVLLTCAVMCLSAPAAAALVPTSRNFSRAATPGCADG